MRALRDDVLGGLSHQRRWLPGVVQQVCPPEMFDLGPGYLDPGLLPVDLLRGAYADALAEFGSAALSYGDNRGVLTLRTLLARRVTETEGRACGPEQLLVTAGTSHAIDLIATILARPGDVVLVDQYCYDLGRQIFADCGLRPRQVPMDSAGMDPDALHDAVMATRSDGTNVAFVYLNPTFHNPTGLVVPTSRRRELIAAAARHGVLIVEDDAYAELALDGTAPPCSLAGLADYRGVIRLRTFSKTLAPGLRLGWLLGEPAMVDRLAGHGLFVSGGSANHVASLAVTVLLRTGAYDRHVGWLKDKLLDRRDALAGSLLSTLDERVEFTLPTGGFFLWLRFPAREQESILLAAASAAGVNVAAGSRFGVGPRPHVRLAFSFNPPSRLATAAHMLAKSWHTTFLPANRS